MALWSITWIMVKVYAKVGPHGGRPTHYVGHTELNFDVS